VGFGVLFKTSSLFFLWYFPISFVNILLIAFWFLVVFHGLSFFGAPGLAQTLPLPAVIPFPGPALGAPKHLRFSFLQ